MDEGEMPDDERMSPAELVVILQWLGLDQRALARLLAVDERTVRRWVAGDSPIPDGVRLDIEAIEQATAAAVGEVVAALHDARDPGVLVYRTSEAMHDARPDTSLLPAGWWRMVCARAVHEVPGVAIEWAP